MDGLGLASAPGLGQFDFIDSHHIGQQQSTAALTADTSYFRLFRLARPLVIDRSRQYLGGTQTGNMIADLYSSDGVTLTRLCTSGTVAVGATGGKQDLTWTAITIPAGRNLYHRFAISSATPTVARGIHSVTFVGGSGQQLLQLASTFDPGATVALADLANSAISVWFHLRNGA